jgi:acetyltransferase-like isoleucine patch superfamily enzyme
MDWRLADWTRTDRRRLRGVAPVTPPRLGSRCRVERGVTFLQAEGDQSQPVVGDGATIRSGTVVYPDVEIGDRFTTGHRVLVREETTIGDDVLLGTDTVVDGATTIADDANLQTGVYVPRETHIGERVFLGPRAVLTNDPYPLRREADLLGPVLEADVSIGANATLLPGVAVGERSFVAAGAVVTEDVPPRTLAVGAPAEHRPLPDHLDVRNEA